MKPNTIEKLTELFSEFPGIGPRQAKRFVFFLLKKNPSFRKELADEIVRLGTNIYLCKESFQHFYSTTREQLSPIAQDSNRDRGLLMIVEKDTDIDAIERSGTYNGTYFVLGGTFPVMEKSVEKYIRSKELIEILTKRTEEIQEVIIALSVTPDGEHTADFVRDLLAQKCPEIKITQLGRGISTGTELEYIDSDTLKNALENRS